MAEERKPRPLLDLLLGIVIPSVILMQLSGDDQLGARGSLVIALAFPLALGAYELIRYKVTNFIALLGLVSVLLTGGIGLLELDAQWLAVKEAAIPAIIGVIVLVSTQLGYPLVKVLLYNPKVLNTEKISGILRERGFEEQFDAQLLKASYFLGGTFFFSAVMNYLLATWIVTSQAGSAEFNEELGRLTLLSYPVIAIPSMLMMAAILYYLWQSIHKYTGLNFEAALSPALTQED